MTAFRETVVDASLWPQVLDLLDHTSDDSETALATQRALQALVDLYDELEPWRNIQYKVSLFRLFPTCIYQMHIEFYGTWQVAQHKSVLAYSNKQRALTPRCWQACLWWTCNRWTAVSQSVSSAGKVQFTTLWPWSLTWPGKFFLAISTHMINIYSKFHWNPSTKYRDIHHAGVNWQQPMDRWPNGRP